MTIRVEVCSETGVCSLIRLDNTKTDLLPGEVAAIAAYNAGAGAVSQWVADAGAAGHPLRVADLPYPEPRAYVPRVMHLKAADRKAYGDRLGPAY